MLLLKPMGLCPFFCVLYCIYIRWESVPCMLLFGHGQCLSEGKTFSPLTLCVITPKKDSQKLSEMELVRLLLIFPSDLSSYMGTEMWNTVPEEISLFFSFPL